MGTRTRQIFGALSLAGALAIGAVATSAQTTVGDGLVNVAVGDISILDNARIGVAANVAAQICGIKVGPVVVLGRSVDLSGGTQTVCTSNQGPVTISQN